MARRYTSFNALKNGINDDVKLILENDVAPVMEDILRDHIRSDIYDVGAGTPQEGAWINGTTYHRRHVLENSVMHFFNKRENQINVTSNATASPSVCRGWSFHNRRPGVFLQMLENGDMGFVMKSDRVASTFPRPALSNAQEEINGNTRIFNAIRRGLGG